MVKNMKFYVIIARLLSLEKNKLKSTLNTRVDFLCKNLPVLLYFDILPVYNTISH